MNKRIAITSGEPSGIGPELMYHLSKLEFEDIQFVVLGDRKLIEKRASLYGSDFTISEYDKNRFEPQSIGNICIMDIPLNVESVAGHMDSKNAQYVIKLLKTASDGCISKEFKGIVTGPISKAVITEVIPNFTGHTEYFQNLTNTKKVVMMLGCDKFNVALATTHLPIKDISKTITKELLFEIVTILNHDLKTKFGIKKPHIISSGLNPHAGEDGHLGTEELDTIIPAFNELREKGIDIEGPLPADTMFQDKYIERADAFLTMYHDQGLPVLKYAGFDSGFNTTLGLPYIRTSVDHGTALDLAGKGIADAGSLICAINLAADMARRSIQE